MYKKKILTIKILCLILTMILIGGLAMAANIDPDTADQIFAYGENIGWINLDPSEGPGVTVSNSAVTGYAWSENAGWINFDPTDGGVINDGLGNLSGYAWGENIGWISFSCENTSSCGTVNFGVTNDGSGNLAGYAWGENVGWINFDPNVPGDPADYGVTIDSEGEFDGWAWGENIGWIRFDSTKSYNVQACTVTLEDLANFVADWLEIGNLPANLNEEGGVDMQDFSIFAFYWLGFCPDNWTLK